MTFVKKYLAWLEDQGKWSQEEENILTFIRDCLNKYFVNENGGPYVAGMDSREAKAFRLLSSLKPCKRYRPKMKQMEALRTLIYESDDPKPKPFATAITLYEDLQELLKE